MKMSKFIVKTTMLIFMMFLLSTGVQGFFKQSNYILPLEKSVLLGETSKPNENLCWTSENPKIAEVNNDGIVTSKSQGKTRIWVKYKNNNSAKPLTCEVTVIDPEPIRAFYISPNVICKDSFMRFNAVTSKNISEVYFKYKTIPNGAEKSEKAEKKSEKDGVITWGKNIKAIDEGLLVAGISAKSANEWFSFEEYNIEFNIKNQKDVLNSGVFERTISDKGLQFISEYEGCPKKVYKDVGGNLTVGFGQLLLHGVNFYESITTDEQYAHLIKLVNGFYTEKVNEFLISNKIKFNQHQFDALVSFVYNLGPAWLSREDSDIRNVLLEVTKFKDENEKDLKNVDNQKLILIWSKYHHCSGKCFKGLLRRRFCEAALFLEGIYETLNFNPRSYPIPECYQKMVAQS